VAVAEESGGHRMLVTTKSLGSGVRFLLYGQGLARLVKDGLSSFCGAFSARDNEGVFISPDCALVDATSHGHGHGHGHPHSSS
jgi:hypothetical protein